ncbi:uncharacterized protein LOC110010074 [Jatropha curcas]|uniref:uncharacterized protein LOC110010074 n=1 Tax=Jatropha curcas TaxID=180498 RepID=UPI00189437A2|nr:uncharacterized protein LOC110010074 [Jatropha curcas]
MICSWRICKSIAHFSFLFRIGKGKFIKWNGFERLLLLYLSLGMLEEFCLAPLAKEQGNNNVAFFSLFVLSKANKCLQLLISREVNRRAANHWQIPKSSPIWSRTGSLLLPLNLRFLENSYSLDSFCLFYRVHMFSFVQKDCYFVL